MYMRNCTCVPNKSYQMTDQFKKKIALGWSQILEINGSLGACLTKQLTTEKTLILLNVFYCALISIFNWNSLWYFHDSNFKQSYSFGKILQSGENFGLSRT
jgi:hypothetical protein